MAKKDPAKSAAKWQRNLQAAADSDYVDGTMALTEAPSKRAIAKKATLKARFNQAIDDGTWERNLSKVTLQEHQEAVRTRGARNLSQAASDKVGNTQNFLDGWNEYAFNASQTVRAMPNKTDAENDARMLKNLALMRAGKGKFSKRR